MATVDFSVLFNAEDNKFQFIDTADYPGQSISTSNVLGNLKVTSPSGVVIHNNTDYTAETGSAVAGGSNTITFDGTGTLSDYTGYFVRIYAGTGVGQIRKISAYNDTTKVATVFPYWGTPPDNTSDYEVCFSDINLHATYTPETGTDGGYTANTRNTIILGGGASSTNDYYNGMWVILDDGQARQISDYVGSTKTATVSEDWTTLPASNTYYINYTFFAPFQDTTNISQTSSDTEISIPLDADGNIEQGDYLFEYSVKDTTASPAVYYAASKTFNYCIEFPTLSLSVETDCIIPQIESVDTTEYAVQEADTLTNDRTNELFYPVINGVELDPVVSTTATVSTGTLYNRTYTSYLKSRLTYTFTDAVYVYEALETEEETRVDCPADLCDLFCCENSIYTQWQGYVSTNTVLADQYKNKFITIMAIKALMWDAVKCNKPDLIEGYVAQILSIGGCTSGCGCTGDEPVLITGLGNAGSVSIVAAGNGTSVASSTVGNTTTYTVSLSNAILTKINALTAIGITGLVNVVVAEPTTGNFTVTGATISSTDGSVTITTTVNGGGIITNYDLSAKTPIVLDNDWTAETNTVFPAFESLKTYPIVATTLAANESEIRTKSFFTRLLDATLKIKLNVAGADITGAVTIPKNVYTWSVETCIVRKTATTADIWIRVIGYTWATQSWAAEAFYLNQATNNWTSGANNDFKILTSASLADSLRYDYQQVYVHKI